MPVLQIKWVPPVFASNTSYPARYIPENEGLDQVVSANDESYPIAMLQTVVDGIAAGVESNLPGQYTVDMTTRRRIVFDKIDRRSREILAAGYKHTDNRYYPVTDDALIRYLNVISFDVLTALLAPFTFETLDQANTLSFPVLSLGSAQAFAKKALAFAHNTMNAGFVLKDSVRACTTKAQLEAIVDSR